MLAVLLGTLLFGCFISLIPLILRVQAQKEINGSLITRVYLWPWPVPFVLEGSDLVPGGMATFLSGLGQQRHTRRQKTRHTRLLARSLKFWRGLKRISRRLYRNIICFSWELHLVIGGAEAASTAWLAGGCWLWQAAVRQNLATRVRLRTVPRLSVWPSFNEAGLGLRLDCILGVRLIHIISADLSLAVAAWRTLGRGKEVHLFGKPSH
jgi:hypothetical protein